MVELRLRVSRDNAPARRCDCFAEIGAARGGIAAIGDGVAIGAHRIVETADFQKHRREHIPAPAVSRIFLKMAFDLRHQLVHRSCRQRRARALRERKVSEPGRSIFRIDHDRHQRQCDQRNHRDRAAERQARGRRRCRLRIGRGQKTAADLDARGFRLACADHAAVGIALNLGELILVDHRLAAFARGPRATPERPQHGKHRRGSHQREHEPERHSTKFPANLEAL